MDFRLSRDPATEPVRRRAAAFAVLWCWRWCWSIGWLTARLAERMAEIDATPRMPARIEVAYVQDARARGAASRWPRRPPPRPAAAAAGAAGGAKRVEPAASAASAPAVVEEPAADRAWQRPRSPGRPPPGPGDGDGGRGERSRPAVVVADAAAPASAAAAASAVEGFVWPKATRVSYVLTGNWRGDLNGRAEVEWIKIDDRYQVNVAMHAGPRWRRSSPGG